MQYTVKRATQPVTIDAKWDKAPWTQTEALELQNHIKDRPEHFPQTQAKLLYDDENIYVIFRVKDRYVRSLAIVQ